MLFTWYNEIVFANPEFLWGLALIPFVLYLRIRKRATIPVSSIRLYTRHQTWRTRLSASLIYLQLLSAASLLIALARPQKLFTEKQFSGKGIDLVLCMDVSGSMLAEDFLPNRLSAAKEVAIRFVQKRATDRIGLVLFSGESYTISPVTADKRAIIHQLQSVRTGLLKDGTAIGNGLAGGILELRSTASKEKVMLLLTDGENNAGSIGVLDAAHMAQRAGIKIYTIGVGADGYAVVPTMTESGVVRRKEPVKLDEDMLRSVAQLTGGKFFRAANNNTLDSVYAAIDRFEPSSYTEKSILHRDEWYRPFVLFAFFLLLLYLLIDNRLAREVL